MLSGTLAGRRAKTRLFWSTALCALAATALAGGAAHADDDTTPIPSFFITPTLGVQLSYTDNANLTSSDRDSDLITRGSLGLDAAVNRGPLTGKLNARYDYDWYSSTNDLNGGSLSMNGSGIYSILRDRLWIEAAGSVTNGYTSTFGASAVDRSGVEGRTQLGVYNIGPRFATTLGSYADLAGALRWEQVLYTNADGSETPHLPHNDNIGQAVMRIDTGARFAKYQLLTTGQYEQDNMDFRTGNIVQSVYFSVLPGLRLIARAGYEHVFQPGVTDIDAPVLSAGVEIRPNRYSTLSFEGGRRYDRTSWSARANVQVTDKIYLNARYMEMPAPDQLYVAQSFQDFVEESASLPLPIVPGVSPATFIFRENLYNQTSFNKTADLHALYSGVTQSLDLSARWSDRHFLAADTHDRSVTAYGAYTRRLRYDLDAVLAANYARTLESPVYGKSETYGGSVRAVYRLNSTMMLTTSYSYTHGKQLFPGGEKIRENVVLIALQKNF
jgi:uncharacterized protein (PEP-CTERM system associated)